MSLKERIVKVLFGDVIQQEIEKSSKQVISHVTGISSAEGVLPEIDFEIFNQMYEQTSWVRAVVGVISKAVTARGYTLTPAKPNADIKNLETLQEFFASCNPNDTLLEILDDVTRDIYVFGNAFLEVVLGPDGKPRELWNLDATTIRAAADEHGAITGYVQVPRYVSTRNQTNRVDFLPSEVIHFKLGTKGATLYGLSPLASLILPVTVDKFAQVYNRAFFINGAKIRGAFIMKDATPEQVERNREYLSARAKNPDMAHSDMVLEGDIEFKQISVPQKDMEFLELREFTRNEILSVYGVPPSKVSIIETGNIGAGTGEHQTQTFYEETILPFQMRVAEKVTKHIIRQGFGITDWSFQFNKRSIDEKDQAEIFNIYLQNGVFKPEEVRRLVAPRIPELQKTLDLKSTIVNGTKAVVKIENQFVDALKRVFREIKNSVEEKLHALNTETVKPKLSKLAPHVSVSYKPLRGLNYKSAKFPDAVKQIDELEVILQSVDTDKLSRTIERYSLTAARKGAKLSARRADIEDVDDISLALEENLKNNSSAVAAQVSDSLKSSLRQSLIEGITADETIPQLIHRIEGQLDSVATVSVKPVLDDSGSVLRSGHERQLSRSTAAELIARSEANRAFNEGNLDALKQAEIVNVQWLLSSDSCPECIAASEGRTGDKFGKVLSIDEASGVIPVHPNCRCTWIAVTTEE